MSTRQVVQSQIVCDGCGVEYPRMGKIVADTRAMAALDQWKHQLARHGHSNWPKQIDLCPTCEEPK